MKILREYVWDTLRRNKRTSISIMIALFLMTTMMSCLCGFIYTMWTDSVASTKWEYGDWHGELFDNTSGDKLEHIENYSSVSAVMVKGNWQTARLSEDGRRNYLIFRGANEEYWKSMPEKDDITKGRVPSSEDELVLSKQYFAAHPEVKIGDTLTLPLGQRVINGKVCMPTELFHEDETFTQTGTKTYKIVGEMDVTTSSSVPAYTGMSYLSRNSIQPTDDITVYLRFHSMRDTYKELPALAESVGYEKDEYGKYNLRYNTSLLYKYAILSPEQIGAVDRLSVLSVPLMFLVIAALVVSVFVLVIHNAFALSVDEKLIQLGTLAGIGASPGQIQRAVASEAFILMIIPLPLGILSGWGLDIALFRIINQANDIGRAAPDLVLTFGLPAILPAILLSFITVFISARIPAGKVAKMLPVEILRQEGNFKKKRLRKSRINSRFGIVGELASNSLSARSRSYRTATISLCMSFLLLTGFLYIITAQKASAAIYKSDLEKNSHISFTIRDGRTPDAEALKRLKEVPDITKSVMLNKLPCAIWVRPEDASEDIEKYLGGFDDIAASKKYSTIERNGQYRIASVVIGLERDSFTQYCRQINADPDTYFNDSRKAIVYNYTEDPDVSTKKKSVYRELLKIQEGQNLDFTEKDTDETEGNSEFTLTAGQLVHTLPLEGISFSRFTLVAIMPMEHVLDLGTSCSERRQASANALRGYFLTDDTNGISYPLIEKASKEITKILDSYYGSGDYILSDLALKKEMQEDTGHVMNLIAVFLAGLLAVIGLSNAWASISGNLRQRQQEFAMLKSAGLSPGQLWNMLFLEGLSLGLKPVLISVPFQFLILAFFLYINEVTLAEYLPFAPIPVILGYTGLILLAIITAYFAGGRKIQKENIITAIKDDTI